MSFKPELVQRVKNFFDLNIYETKVWLALLKRGIASAGEIAESSGVPRSRTYDVLESLEKRGFAVQKIGKPVKYLAVKPVSVLDKLKKNTMQEMNVKLETLSNIKGTPEYQELEVLHSSNINLIKNQDLSGTIRGRANVNSHISEIISNAKKQVIICTSVEDLRKRQKTLEPLFKEITKSGVKLIVALNGPEPDILSLSQKIGIRTKRIELDSSFYIADKDQIIFMLNKPNETADQIAVWFSSPFFVQSFTGLFDMALRKIDENKK